MSPRLNRFALFAGLAMLAFMPLGSGAQISIDGDCQLLASFSGLTTPLDGDDQIGYQKVVSPAGTARLTCHFRIPEGHIPDQVLVNECNDLGCSCNIEGLGSTIDAKSIATPGGTATLICKINPSSPPLPEP